MGRTSTEEQQDPRQSLLRQWERCQSALPEAWAIVCHFYDVESGRKELSERSRGSDYERFGIPIARDGGIVDLLAEAAQPDRRFDAVICESTSRVARRMYENLFVERELEHAGVPLFAWNEPIKLDGGRAQQILQRRINQSVAEYEVYNALETSWGGLCTHVREGWNIGKPPYGYKAKAYRHPNPAKAARGATKSRLEPDGLRAKTVTQIAQWRFHDRVGYSTIVDRLNADPDRFPPPTPPGGTSRARGAWSKSTVCGLLCNPKYTGYQVFNRRATRSRHGAHNDPRLWVWSPEPVHEPLISKWMFDELVARRQDKRGSRDGNALNKHPATRRTYVLRGLIHCACGRRLFGNHRHRTTYYSCWPRANNRGRPDVYAGHPATLYINEADLLEAIGAFFADRVFGPERRALLVADLRDADVRADQERETERERLQRALADLARGQDNILRQAREGAPDDPFTRGLRQTYNDLEAQRTATRDALAELDAAEDSEPSRPTAQTADLLDALPYLAVNLARAPERLQRQLYEITQLTIRLHANSDDVTLSIRLPADRLSEISRAAEAATGGRYAQGPATTPVAGPCPSASRTDAVRAPGRIRTCDTRFRSSWSPRVRVVLPRLALPCRAAYGCCCVPSLMSVVDVRRPSRKFVLGSVLDSARCLRCLNCSYRTART
ncbi:recombinase family protein [Streptomyces lasiicapitis]|uniref:recombinase family protein n=1 Tax=Streptomyces lasiicapitis TaxID=1923961 RepID=UPI00364BA6B6